LDEKFVTVMINLGRREAKKGFETFNYKKGKDLESVEELKLGREEGRMWVFIRPRGGQDCYLLTYEIRGGLEFCPIHRFDGMDQIPLH
jgi:hypothetical protein